MGGALRRASDPGVSRDAKTTGALWGNGPYLRAKVVLLFRWDSDVFSTCMPFRVDYKLSSLRVLNLLENYPPTGFDHVECVWPSKAALGLK